MPKQIAKVGDVFWVPLDDESMVLGQIIEIQKEAMNSITCAFFDCRKLKNESVKPSYENPIAVQFVTKDLFNSGNWHRECNQPSQNSNIPLPYREAERNGWVGAKIIGSGIIRRFLGAFYGLRSWDEMHNPEYYQQLLLPGVTKYERA